MTPGSVKISLIGFAILIAVILGLFGYRAVNSPQDTVTAAAPQPVSVPQPSGDGRPAEAPAQEEQASAADTAAPSSPGTTPAERVQAAFDIVRVEPDGETVVAGRAAPGSVVELLRNGAPVAQDTANSAGEFVIVPPALGKGDHELTLRARSGDGVEMRSESSVVVSIPESGEVLVVESRPGAPSEVLQKPQTLAQETAASPEAAQPEQTAQAPEPEAAAQATPSSEPAAPASGQAASAATEPALRIGVVEVEDGRLIAQGQGPSGSSVRIYLNDAPIAEAVIGDENRWSLTVERGVTPGNYRVRVDQVDESGQVTSRAEVPFTYRAPAPVMAEATVPDTATSPAPEAAPALDRQTVAAPDTRSETAPAAAIPPASPANAVAGAHEAARGSQPVAEAQQAPAADAAAPSGVTGPAPAAQADVAAPATSADAVVADLDTVTVERGDSLWRISRSIYGRGIRYTVIYDANDDQIRNPNLIYPGQVFVVPQLKD